MVEKSEQEDVATTMRSINRAWLGGSVENLAQWIHPDVVTVFAGFNESIAGRDALLGGFRDFCQNATVHEFRERDYRTYVIGKTAIVHYTYEMLYERSGSTWRATGRDLWVFQKQDSGWQAVWRTMLNVEEKPA